MRVLKLFGGLTGAVVFWAGGALADDVALILGDIGQIAAHRSDTSATSTDFAAPLREAGFEIIQPKNRSSGNMRLAAQQVETALADGAVDRLVIVVMGPLASSDRESWALSNGGGGASSLNAGVTGISLGALSDMAKTARDRAVILIAPGKEIDTLGNGLTPGLADLNEAQGVTYIVGPAEELVEVVNGGLLEADTSFAELARVAPEEIKVSGFVSEQIGLMGQGLAVDAEAAEERGFWAAAQAIDTQEAYLAYLDAYPGGAYESEVADRLNFLQSAPEREARDAEEGLNLTREARRGIQRDLALLGFDPRGIDGLFGPGSRAAISAWQRDQGFEETGFLNGNQLLRLREAAGVRAAELEAEAKRVQAEKEKQDRAYWRDTGRTGDEVGLRKYLQEYPDGEFADIAQARLDEIEEGRRAETAREEREAWDKARESDDINAYEVFLADYPASGFAPAAQDRLRQLTEEARDADIINQAKAEEKQVAGGSVARLVVEKRLAQIGADPGKVDGKFNKKTRQAIRRYQRLRDLPVTGYVSRQTMVRLLAGG